MEEKVQAQIDWDLYKKLRRLGILVREDDDTKIVAREIKNFTDLVRQQEERQRNDINSFIERKMKIM